MKTETLHNILKAYAIIAIIAPIVLASIYKFIIYKKYK